MTIAILDIMGVDGLKLLEETVARLNNQRNRDFSNKTLEDEAKGSTGLGFTASRGPKNTFDDRNDFDRFMEDELANWDFNPDV